MQDDRRNLLAQHFLLQHLPPKELDQVVAFAQTRRYAADEMIFNKGDPGDGLLAIVSGRVRIGTISRDGREVVLNILDAGAIFGEIALIDGRERTAHAIAMTPTEILFLDRGRFLPFLESHPSTMTRLLVVLCDRIRWVSEMVEDTLFLDLPGRLAKKLLGLARDYGEAGERGTRITLKLSQQDLANLIGMTRESVNKQLRAWQDDGLIALDHGYVTILDEDGLQGRSDNWNR